MHTSASKPKKEKQRKNKESSGTVKSKQRKTNESSLQPEGEDNSSQSSTLDEPGRSLEQEPETKAPPNKLKSRSLERQADEEWAAMEAQVEAELANSGSRILDLNLDWVDKLIADQSLNPSNKEDREDFFEEALEFLLDTLENNQILTTAIERNLKDWRKMVKEIASPEIEDFVNFLEKADEINEVLSRPLQSQAEASDSELEAELAGLVGRRQLERQDSSENFIRELEAELDDNLTASLGEQVREFIDQIGDDALEQVAQTEENLLRVIAQNEAIVEKIRQLQERMGIRNMDDVERTLNYNTRTKLKKAGTYGLTGASLASSLVPALKVPTKIANTALNAISLAKSIQHIRNMQDMLGQVSNPQVRAVIEYAIAQKTKKSVHKGLKVAQLGPLSTTYTTGKMLKKTIQKTKGEKRKIYAKELHDLALRGDPEAVALVKELVGSGNIEEALNPAQRKAGRNIVMAKLAST